MNEALKQDRQFELGQYMTPLPVARQMVSLIDRPSSDWLVLDPACGDGNLLIAAAERMIADGVTQIHERIIGIDIDAEMTAKARFRLSELLNVAEEDIWIFTADFRDLSQRLATVDAPVFAANVVLANPPYGKLREYEFFKIANTSMQSGSELIYLLPLAFMDRVIGTDFHVLKGRPLGVTTGHVIATHKAGEALEITSTRKRHARPLDFRVQTGVKLYELGAGIPSQTHETMKAKPFSSDIPQAGWLPCVRTGDVRPFGVVLDRLWVNYGEHLAHPKNIERFQGPRLFVRRVPMWTPRALGCVYVEETALCAGDVLVVRSREDDIAALKGLAVYLNSPQAVDRLMAHRPSIKHRDSFPKFAAKDLEFLIAHGPSTTELRRLSTEYGAATCH